MDELLHHVTGLEVVNGYLKIQVERGSRGGPLKCGNIFCQAGYNLPKFARPKTKIAPGRRPSPKRIFSSSNPSVSGAKMLVYRSVTWFT